MFPPSSPPQSPLRPISKDEGFVCPNQMKNTADEEERGDDDPKDEGDSVTRLAQRVDHQITGDPVAWFSVGW